MKTLLFVIYIYAVSLTQLAFADAEAEAEANILLSSMGMKEAMTESMSQMVDLQLQQNPALAPYKSVMMDFFSKHMSWESLKPDFLKIYVKAFSAKELREINEFYSTETGKKTIRLMPSLMAQGGQVGATRVQENMAELQAMIAEESARLQKLSTQ